MPSHYSGSRTEPQWITTPIHRPGPAEVTYHIPSSLPSSSTGPTTLPPPTTTLSLPRHSSWTSGLHFHATHIEYLRLISGAIHVYLDGRDMILSADARGLWDPNTGSVEKLDEMVVKVERHARHDWGRAEPWLRDLERKRNQKKESQQGSGAKSKVNQRFSVYFPPDVDEEVVVQEFTDPADLSKPLFFWNLNAVLTTSPPALNTALRRALGRDTLIMLQLSTIFWALDNFPVVWNLHGVLSPCLGAIGGMVERLVEYVVSVAWLWIVSSLGEVLGLRAVEESWMPVDIQKLWKQLGASRTRL